MEASGTVLGLPRTWIFQANPNKYRIKESLRIEDGELWCLRQHAKKINVHDRVLLWISGTKAGIYAVGTVMTAPIAMPDSPAGLGYWNEKHQGEHPYPRVWVRYDRVMLDHPLLRDFLKLDPELRNMAILRSPRGTNFKVTEAQAAALDVWLDG